MGDLLQLSPILEIDCSTRDIIQNKRRENGGGDKPIFHLWPGGIYTKEHNKNVDLESSLESTSSERVDVVSKT